MFVSGDLVELYTYENPVVTHRITRPTYTRPVGRSSKANNEDQIKNRGIALQRAKKQIKRLIHSNCDKWFDKTGKKFKPILMTLTYAENMMDVSIGNSDYRNFIQRLNYYLYKDRKSHLKYVAVPEFQDRGSLHYHAVLFNLPFVPIDELVPLWKHGSIHLSGIENEDNGKIATYMTKSLNLEKIDDRLTGQKCYLASQGMLKPKETTDKKRIEGLIGDLAGKRTFDTEFANNQYGTIKYERYKK